MNINKLAGYVELEVSEVRSLIQGKFDFRKCLDCNGSGRELCDGEYGEVVTSGVIPENRDKTYFYWDVCESCHGLGGFLKIK